ncbi:tRNA (guanosine(37)-N1)-methyltransferase TrmD [Alkalibacter rhizosphaerae]|uniref:tRNA (guanine-N(1)-)-methyltransferase n=1 Tax=Alkalibacter rhizosphaerae TaxID=2815577 RepID=A0A975AHK6_9FIRM|nr:tRNA (guanosine(37)-N1)-methyltransferase TrmD [Alkalibacter rhizosphaerae]QSX08719.1 tRNA (guanosine(37)-N1)-methyltransferase TrmD [Alkalibacter rhizosphaerae]
MKFVILSVVPEIFQGFLDTSIVKRAMDKGCVEVEVLNIRDFSENKHKKTDDYPFGGGPGMVMTPQPIADAIKEAKNRVQNGKVIYFTPKGKVYDQQICIDLAATRQDLILLCGHYEGVDQRVLDLFVDMELSMGDYVLTGGEIPAMALVDSVSRLLDGVLGNAESADNESFSSHLLEYPQYTRPREYEGIPVPEVLLGGNHKDIDQWRHQRSLEETREKRPDLYEKYEKGKE